MTKYLLILLFLSIVFSSCRILNSNEMFKEKSQEDFLSFEETPKEYVIKPFDKLDLKIFSNKGERLVDVIGANRIAGAENIEYKVEYDGYAKLPLIDTFKISDLTIRQAEDSLEKAYTKYFKDPFVYLSVSNKRIILFSEGSTAGTVINMKEDNYTLIEAIAEAGGISNYSKSYKIKLIRGDLNKPKVYRFDLSKIEKLKDFNFVLQANDIIYVESRPQYSSKLLQELSPYLGLITTGLLVVNLFK